jgi:hypothetical protein
MAGLPYDALTAALDAWLAQHIPNLTRRARVRQAVDCLDDLRTAPYAHIEFATDLSNWPALPRVRFLRALRELRGEPAVRFDRMNAGRDARVGRWVEVYWPGDERWYRGRVTTQLGPLLRVFYDDGEAHFHAFRDEPFRGDGVPPFAPEDAPQQWRYAFARIY